MGLRACVGLLQYPQLLLVQVTSSPDPLTPADPVPKGRGFPSKAFSSGAGSQVSHSGCLVVAVCVLLAPFPHFALPGLDPKVLTLSYILSPFSVYLELLNCPGWALTFNSPASASV